MRERPGERRFEGNEPDYADAGLVFIGHVRTPWTERSACPKNMRMARDAGQSAQAVLLPRYRPALEGLAAGGYVTLVTFLHEAERNLALQMPRHALVPRGTFSLRSPVRPNPIGLHLVRLLAIERDAGLLSLDAIDVLDGTPLIDIKPYLPSVDIPPE